MPEPQLMSLGAFLRTFVGYIRPHRAKAGALLLLLGVDVAFKTAWPLSFKFLIDHALTERNQRVLFVTLAALLAGVLLATLCSILRDYLYGTYASLLQKQSGFTFNPDGDQAGVQPARLRRYPILQELSDAILADLADAFVTEAYAADRVVVQEGEPGDRFYIIARGKVRVSQTQPGGREETVAVLDDGDYFGEVALLRNEPRNATVTTAVPCVLLSLRRQQFRRLLEQAPQILASLRQGRPPPAGPASAPRTT